MDTTRPVDPTEDPETWPTSRLLSVAARVVEARWAMLLETLGLTHAGLVALHHLGEDALAQRALARRCRVTDQTISRTVDRLVRSGFAERTADPADRRRQLVRPTPAGRAVYTRAADTERTDPVVTNAIGDDAAFRERLLTIIRRLGESDGSVPAGDPVAD
ncbi:DNA-binding transcriptional regulator, MarR family [Amycolatopsis arida]|uniref:DNA-binding transcriptional regulator, MarR family n=1 Tax=Amycolatopsis arida TaxID=587909 RepID=A0A1I5ZRK9_9PSEU|nr:MarR family transcriptional regulator [Amycolatopsis arida]TDX89295.1 DNA-binding MarR family transcriptional regulator [Amycolatopsis arida]SFQ58837.1 DNA-binding transcriptional regulator, MarR family [Amycolatopsis arida]